MKPVVIVSSAATTGCADCGLKIREAISIALFHSAQASGTKVVLAGITLPPDYGPDYIRQFNETYSLLAASITCRCFLFAAGRLWGGRHDAAGQDACYFCREQDCCEEHSFARDSVAEEVDSPHHYNRLHRGRKLLDG